MNTKVLKEAEMRFLKKYAGGFRHPEMVEMGKKHRLDKLEQLARETFTKESFDDPAQIVAGASKLVSRSTLVSMFEKPKFRDMVKGLTVKEKEPFAEALYELLHGKESGGFELLVAELDRRKLAKWPLATILQTYYRPRKEVFIKPTTAKLIIDELELDLEYSSTPTWSFYRRFRKSIKEIGASVSKDVAPNHPALCGFLMMSLGGKL